MAAGERLREERVRLGYTQGDFAQLGGVNRNTQGSYEKGERNPDSAYLVGVAAMGADVVYVLFGERTTPPLAGLSRVEEKLVEQFRALPEPDQAAFHRILGAMWEMSAKGKE